MIALELSHGDAEALQIAADPLGFSTKLCPQRARRIMNTALDILRGATSQRLTYA